jgi:7-carboxy-7-deazaguanine synthase
VSYRVKETFVTLQGEGINAGRVAVFCRFAGCNLWTGKESQRASAVCRFCDTDFVGIDGEGGGTFPDAAQLAEHIESRWFGGRERRLVVFTGGEPLLQLDSPLLDQVHARGFEIAIETNGTKQVPAGIDWICMSPKAGAPIVATSGHELKLVFPQAGLLPADVEHLDFEHLLLQPMDGDRKSENTRAAVQYCLTHRRWRLSLQTHKYVGIP